MHRPVITITIAYIAGILLGHGFLYFPYSTLLLMLLGTLSAGILLLRGKLIFPPIILVAIACIAGFGAYLYSAAWFPADHYTRKITPDKKSPEIIGTISSALDRDPEKTSFVLKLKSIDSTPVSGFVRVTVRDESATVGYNDQIRINGKVFEPWPFRNPGGFDYPAYLARQGIYYTITAKDFSEIEILRRGDGIFRIIQDWRERIRQAFLSSTGGDGSAILQAMVIGEEGRLTEELRDSFMAAGVTHIISISGSHLGMVAVLCFGFLRYLLFLLPERRYHFLTLHVDPKKIAAVLTLPLVFFYTLLAGGQVATVRSLIMICAGLFALLLDRENSLMHALAVAALLVLVPDPQAFFDISFQLSFLSVLVIGFVVNVWNELKISSETRAARWSNSVLLLVIISLATTLATGPLVAYYFNQFSFAGIISNMVVVPFAGAVVVPLGLFSAVLSLFLDHLPFAALNDLASAAFVETVAFFARLPFAAFHPPAPPLAWLPIYAVFLISLAMLCRRILFARFKPFEVAVRIPRISITVTIAASLLLLFPAFSFLSSKRSEITFVDVGQGDCAFIQLASGKTLLIDGGGTYGNRFDIGRRVLAPYLWNKGIHRIDLVILSHPHPDHMNGLLFIVKNFEIGEVWDSGRDRDLTGYADFKTIIAGKNIKHRIVSAEDAPSNFGGAELRILHPAPSFTGQEHRAYAAENNRSLVVKIALQGKELLFTGDVGGDAEERLVRTGRDLKCDLIKVPHHGSKTSSSEGFVQQTRPEIAIIGVGHGNHYGHPSTDVVDRYAAVGARVFRTDCDGALIVSIDEQGWRTARWNDLLPKRIGIDFPTSWREEESLNWSRLARRMGLKTP